MIVLGILTITFIALVALDSLGIFSLFGTVNEDYINNLLEDEFPDGEINTVFNENCTICDDSGCRTYPGPCWKITVITEGEDGTLTVTEMVMDESGAILEKSERPCVEWWCDAQECSYKYSIIVDDLQTEFTNYGCPDLGICDQEYGKCRPCEEGSECVFMTWKSGSESSSYRFEVIGTGEHAELDDEEMVCRIMSRGTLLYSETVSDPSECGGLMYDNTACFDGACDFVPGFDILPL